MSMNTLSSAWRLEFGTAYWARRGGCKVRDKLQAGIHRYELEANQNLCQQLLPLTLIMWVSSRSQGSESWNKTHIPGTGDRKTEGGSKEGGIVAIVI